MNPNITPSEAQPNKPTGSRKRRGRPRSPVFAYFRRLVDENGVFAGNACQFCSFVSRDRSENPTYLTRHILRTCSAPQDVKDAMGVRHPSIAIQSYGNSNRLTVNKPPLPTAPPQIAPAVPQHIVAERNLQVVNVTQQPNRPDVEPVSRDQTQQEFVSQQNHCQPQQAQWRKSQQNETPKAPAAVQVREQVLDRGCFNQPPARTSKAQAQKILPSTSRPKLVQVEKAQHVKEGFQGASHAAGHIVLERQPQAGLIRARQEPQQLVEKASEVQHQQSQLERVQELANVQDGSLKHGQVTQIQQLQEQQLKLQNAEQSPKAPLVPANPGLNRTVPGVCDQAKAAPSQPGEVQLRRADVQTTIRPVGVSKSRRGRPRSPALHHFRRHVDDTGTFIANQCIYCSFVSRDRSENSTLLLRHLLSKLCKAPENVRIVLRGNRYDLNGKRTLSSGKTSSSKSPKKKAIANSVRRKDQKLSYLGKFATSPEAISKAVVRFFSKHDIDLAAVESPVFTDLVKALTTTRALTDGALPSASESKEALEIGDTEKQEAVETSCDFPTREVLEAFWGNTPTSQILDDESANDLATSPTHLIVYFPSYSQYDEKQLMTGQTSPLHTNQPEAFVSDSVVVASAFRWSSASQLRYLGSKNCAGDFFEKLTELVRECKATAFGKEGIFDHVFISRPFKTVDHAFDIPRHEALNMWIPDVAREVDILCQELLEQVPFLTRCLKRNRLLAWFFRERYSEEAAVVLFGQYFKEKEAYDRYLQHVSRSRPSYQCRDILETAINTYAMLCEAQLNHQDPQRVQEISTFLRNLEEDNTGCAQLCQEVTKLVLSAQYRSELKAFVSILTPIANLIMLYSQPESKSAEAECSPSGRAAGFCDVFDVQHPFRARSISHLLLDCVELLRELYAEKLKDCENDVLLLRGHTARRLLGKSSEGCPPIVDDVCYVAAFLNPSTDLSAAKGISVEEAWRRAVAFLHSQYSPNAESTLKVVLEQLQSFHRRTGVFSVPEIFSDAHEFEDPRHWWQRHGSLSPELCAVACRVLSAPTTSFRVIQFIAEKNCTDTDLLASERDENNEKRRSIRWNMNLASLDVNEGHANSAKDGVRLS